MCTDSPVKCRECGQPMEEVERVDYSYTGKDHLYHFDRVTHKCGHCGTERTHLVMWDTPIGQMELGQCQMS